MLDMGFAPDVETILRQCPPQRQTLLFSATMPEWVRRLALRHMHDPETVEISTRPGDPAEVRQLYVQTTWADKTDAMAQILDQPDVVMALIFVETKRTADVLQAQLGGRGYQVGLLHGDLTQRERDRAMQQFRASHVKYLIATNVAARGLDIDDISHVINYDVPLTPDEYLHRVGRTGRAGRAGVAITLITPSEILKLRDVEKHARTHIEPRDPRRGFPRARGQRRSLKSARQRCCRPSTTRELAKRCSSFTRSPSTPRSGTTRSPHCPTACAASGPTCGAAATRRRRPTPSPPSTDSRPRCSTRSMPDTSTASLSSASRWAVTSPSPSGAWRRNASARWCSATRAPAADTAEARAMTASRWQNVVEREQSVESIVEPMVARLLSPHAQAEAHIVDPVRGRIRRCTPAGIAFAQRAMAARPDSTALLASINVPTLVIAGTQDAIIPTSEVLAIADGIPGPRFVELDCGHVSNLELPRVVNDELAAFLVPATMAS